mmetsp:Transcript_7484/g.13183  ORF Transcript_7484/g.13183 Transcript_7484/m.13183 type:complete len:246 (+) Transcript_7484:1609-2346(+)
MLTDSFALFPPRLGLYVRFVTVHVNVLLANFHPAHVICFGHLLIDAVPTIIMDATITDVTALRIGLRYIPAFIIIFQHQDLARAKYRAQFALILSAIVCIHLPLIVKIKAAKMIMANLLTRPPTLHSCQLFRMTCVVDCTCHLDQFFMVVMTSLRQDLNGFFQYFLIHFAPFINRNVRIMFDLIVILLFWREAANEQRARGNEANGHHHANASLDGASARINVVIPPSRPLNVEGSAIVIDEGRD